MTGSRKLGQGEGGGSWGGGAQQPLHLSPLQSTAPRVAQHGFRCSKLGSPQETKPPGLPMVPDCVTNRWGAPRHSHPLRGRVLCMPGLNLSSSSSPLPSSALRSTPTANAHCDAAARQEKMLVPLAAGDVRGGVGVDCPPPRKQGGRRVPRALPPAPAPPTSPSFLAPHHGAASREPCGAPVHGPGLSAERQESSYTSGQGGGCPWSQDEEMTRGPEQFKWLLLPNPHKPRLHLAALKQPTQPPHVPPPCPVLRLPARASQGLCALMGLSEPRRRLTALITNREAPGGPFL